METKTLSQLNALQSLLPDFRKELSPLDHELLCGRLKSLLGCDTSMKSDIHVREMETIIDRLNKRFPGTRDRVRTSIAHRGGDNDNLSEDVKNALMEKIQHQISTQIDLALQDKSKLDATMLGIPELWVFDHLSPAQRRRATILRDWCEDRLEFMHSRGMMRFYTAHGIRHSKRVLKLMVEMLKIHEQFFPEPFEMLALYSAAYCHDLGLMFRGQEDPDDEEMFKSVRKTHGSRVWQMIVGDAKAGILPQWRNMGFENEREAMVIANMCACHQTSCEPYLRRLPSEITLFSDGITRNVRQGLLAAILRLADALDCDSKRLPPEAYTKHHMVDPRQVEEYSKHEIIEDVALNDQSDVVLAMCLRYRYPKSMPVVDHIKSAMTAEVATIDSLTASSGVHFPKVIFNTVEALFLEDYPFL